MKVRLSLCVYEKTCPMGDYTLWVRDTDWDHLPGYLDEDMVHIIVDEDGESSVAWSLRRRFWDLDGVVHLELTHLVVDPNEAMQQTIRTERAPYYLSFWYTESDGRPEPGLRRAGWVTWAERRAAEESDGGAG